MLHSNHPKTQWLKPNVLYSHAHGQWVICNLAGLLAPVCPGCRLGSDLLHFLWSSGHLVQVVYTMCATLVPR